MLAFLSTNWLWILLIGGMLFMHLGHGGLGGGCGGGHADHTATGEKPAVDLTKNEHH